MLEILAALYLLFTTPVGWCILAITALFVVVRWAADPKPRIPQSQQSSTWITQGFITLERGGWSNQRKFEAELLEWAGYARELRAWMSRDERYQRPERAKDLAELKQLRRWLSHHGVALTEPAADEAWLRDEDQPDSGTA